jgi:DNA-binding Xre family transcriptional regulator
MKQKNETLRSIENKTGLAQVTILRARKDDMILKCTLSTLQTLARALGCRIKDLFTED